jgi:membrane protein DedA with SNARE-associated domain
MFKFVVWLISVLAALAGGFYAGRYYETHRDLDNQDIQRFQKRVAEQAGQWAGDMGKKVKGILGSE